ncbi:MAG: PilW family protein [Thiothrix sp.]
MRNNKQQYGISLIELMIAMVVSLVLVAGVGTVYVSSKRNYATRDQFSMMDESARIALNTLRLHLEHAGYATPAKLPLGEDGNGGFYVSGAPDPVAGACGTVGSNAKSALIASATNDRGHLSGSVFTPDPYGDAISIRFIGDSQLSTDILGSDLNATCFRGSPQPRDSLIYNAFHVGIDGSAPLTQDSLGNDIPILYGVGSNGNQSKQPIVNGVENLQFMYGVNLDGQGDTADKYLNATDVSASNYWNQVVSIKAGILVKSLEPVLPKAESQSYQVLDVPISRNDRYQRKVYSVVFYLRNVTEDRGGV